MSVVPLLRAVRANPLILSKAAKFRYWEIREFGGLRKDQALSGDFRAF